MVHAGVAAVEVPRLPGAVEVRGVDARRRVGWRVRGDDCVDRGIEVRPALVRRRAVDCGHARDVAIAKLLHCLIVRRGEAAPLVAAIRDAHEDGDCGPIGPGPDAVADLLPRRVTEVHGSGTLRGPIADDVPDARLGALLASAPARD